MFEEINYGWSFEEGQLFRSSLTSVPSRFLIWKRRIHLLRRRERKQLEKIGKSESLVMKQIRFLPVETSDLICCYF